MSESGKLFERAEIEALKQPFALKQHNMREGYSNKAKTKIRWFAYVDWGEIKERLDEVFPGEWETTEPKITYGATSVTASVAIGIRGVWRGYNGAQDGVTADDAKGAATDAYRRAASMWGIAAYIYDMDFQIKTDSYPKDDWSAMQDRENEAKRLFADWYNRKFGNQPRQQSPAPQPEPDALKQEAAALGATVTDIQDAPKPTREVACAAVTVQNWTPRGSDKAKKRVIYKCADGIYASAFTRDHARQAGYNVDEWTEVNKPYDLSPTAIVTVEQDGEYWNVLSVRKAVSEKAG